MTQEELPEQRVADYNYVIYSIQTDHVSEVYEALQRQKDYIEDYSGIKLLPFVCYKRSRSVVIPVPHKCNLNLLSEAIEPLLSCLGAKVPYWG